MDRGSAVTPMCEADTASGSGPLLTADAKALAGSRRLFTSIRLDTKVAARQAKEPRRTSQSL